MQKRGARAEVAGCATPARLRLMVQTRIHILNSLMTQLVVVHVQALLPAMLRRSFGDFPKSGLDLSCSRCYLFGTMVAKSSLRLRTSLIYL